MKQDSIYYIDLISRYFFGEATPEEVHAIFEWIALDAENKALFEEYRNTWYAFEKEQIETRVDENAEWELLSAKLNLNNSVQPTIIPIHKNKESRTFLTLIMRYAAVFLVFMASGYFLYTYFNKVETVDVFASVQLMDTQLPDGSNITLNKGAHLAYKSDFKKKRSVTLKGEAYFDVAHDARKPFVISTENVRVEVLGTSFYVNTNNANGKVEVILKSGSVAVYYAAAPDNKIILKPGERVEIPKTQEANVLPSKEVNADENFISWKTKKMVFANESLTKIVADLNKVYGSNIQLKDSKLSNCRITATFDNQSLDAVLDIIMATVDVKVTKKADRIVISGNGCN